MQYFPDGPSQNVVAELARGLATLTRAELERVAAARGITVTNLRERDRVATLAATAALPFSITGALHQLDLGELTALRVLWKHGPALTNAKVEQVFAGLVEPERLRAILARLQDRALVLPADQQRSAIYVPSIVLGALLGRDQLGGMAAAAILAGHSAELVAAIARRLGAPPTATTKAARIAFITQRLQDVQVTGERIAALPELARRAFETAISHGGYVTIEVLISAIPELAGKQRGAYYGFGYGSQALFGNQGNAEGLRLLEQEALLIRYPNGYSYALAVPDEVMAALLLAPPAQREHFILPALAPPPAGALPAGGQPTPILDVVELLRFVADLRPALTQRQTFSRVDAKRLARWLSVREPAYADFIFILAAVVPLVMNGERSLVLGDGVPRWLQQDEHSQSRSLLDGWRQTPHWRDDLEDGYQRDAAELESWEPPRAALLELLREAPPAGVAIVALAERLRYGMPMLLLPAPPPELELDERPPLPIAAGFVRGAVRALAWLGIAEPLLDAGGPPAAPVGVRLTPLGRAVLGGARGADGLVPRTDRLIVQPTLDVLAPPNVEPAVYDTLRRFTDPGNASGMRTLTLSPASVRRAIDGGMSTDAIRTFLAAHGGVLPATVADVLGEVQNRHGRIRVGPATFYLAVDDPVLLAELQADRRLAGVIGRTIAPTAAVVRGDSLEKVLERLRAAGHMPVAELPEEGAAPRPARKIRGQGAIVDALTEAMRNRRTLEMEYRPTSSGYGASATTLHQITVEAIEGDELRVRCQTHISDRRFKLARVVSVRPV